MVKMLDLLNQKLMYYIHVFLLWGGRADLRIKHQRQKLQEFHFSRIHHQAEIRA